MLKIPSRERTCPMDMVLYIMAVKRALRDQHGFTPLPGSNKEDPRLEIPDGEYSVTIDGKVDRVKIEKGHIGCCNFEPAS